jgi:hypothetical protein
VRASNRQRIFLIWVLAFDKYQKLLVYSQGIPGQIIY